MRRAGQETAGATRARVTMNLLYMLETIAKEHRDDKLS
jgi:hypothetical protein